VTGTANFTQIHPISLWHLPLLPPLGHISDVMLAGGRER